MKKKIVITLLCCTFIISGCSNQKKINQTNTSQDTIVTKEPTVIEENIENKDIEDISIVVDVDIVDDIENTNIDLSLDESNEVYKLTFNKEIENLTITKVNYLMEQDMFRYSDDIYRRDIVDKDSELVSEVLTTKVASI